MKVVAALVLSAVRVILIGSASLGVQLSGRDQAGRGHHHEGGSRQGEPGDGDAVRKAKTAIAYAEEAVILQNP
jgi:hypothetical protein